MMKRYTRQEMLEALPARFAENYCHGRASTQVKPQPSVVISRLNRIPQGKITRETIRQAMDGWPDWTKHECDECGSDVDVLVSISCEHSPGEWPVCICAPCLARAAEIGREEP